MATNEVAIMKTKLKIDPLELKAEKFLNKSWVIIRKQSKKLTNWLFFYQPEKKMDATFHIIDVLAIIYITFRLSNGI